MPEYSDRTLEETPQRVTQFLTGLATDPVIRTLMFNKAGMSDADVIEGAELLRATFNLPSGERVQIDSPDAQKRRLAVAELDAWDEPNFARIKAALDRHHPEQSAYVFRDLGPAQGFAAVRGVGALLTRLDALERGSDPARKGKAAGDKEAVALLAKRGITPALRGQLQELVAMALSPTETLATVSAADHADRRRTLVALRAWFDEWSSSARAVLTKRAHRIRMGLATRRSPSKASELPQEPELEGEGGADLERPEGGAGRAACSVFSLRRTFVRLAHKASPAALPAPPSGRSTALFRLAHAPERFARRRRALAHPSNPFVSASANDAPGRACLVREHDAFGRAENGFAAGREPSRSAREALPGAGKASGRGHKVSPSAGEVLLGCARLREGRARLRAGRARLRFGARRALGLAEGFVVATVRRHELHATRTHGPEGQPPLPGYDEFRPPDERGRLVRHYG